MGSPLPKKMKGCIGCMVVAGLIVGLFALFCLAYSTHKLVHAVEHHAVWNATVNDPSADCDPTSAKCCPCERAEYGHCCEKRQPEKEGDPVTTCLSSACEPRMSYHWCHYIIMLVSIIVIVLMVALVALGLLSFCVAGALKVLSCLCAPCLAKCMLDQAKEHLDGAAQELQELKKDVEEHAEEGKE